MNELLEQFLSEARDALEGIGAMLMKLEAAPHDTELMAQLFRLVHTLKGNSGLFDFPEISRVLHGGEDLMDAVRHGRVPYSQVIADRLLGAMDFVGMLCDNIEHQRPTDARLAADAVEIANGLRALIGAPAADTLAATKTTCPAAGTTSLSSFVTPTVAVFASDVALASVPESVRMKAWRLAQSGHELLWLRYQPDENCFFQGEDPLHQARQTPGFLWGSLSARSAWPPLAELDAYKCMLDFDLLTSATESEVFEHYRYVPDQIDLETVPPLALVLPEGDTNDVPVDDNFVLDALNFVAMGDWTGLRSAVRTLLDASSATLWLSSALRWIDVMLTSQPKPFAPHICALIQSLRTFTLPNWPLAPVDTALAAIKIEAFDTSAPSSAESLDAATPAPQYVVSPREQILMSVLAVQRQILTLPDNAPWLAGRIKSVVVALTGCLNASGRSHDIAALNQAALAAQQSNQAQPLTQWLDATFTLPASNSPEPDTSAASTAPMSAPTPVQDAAEAQAPATAAVAEAGEAELRFGRRSEDVSSIKSLKVDQVKIDRLMNLIGEMVVAKNAIPYLASRAESVFAVPELAREVKTQYAVINRISEEMQDAIMQVRMMPVSFVMQRFPRLVRDLSRRLGKEVNLVLEGQETAADKNIIESLGDPLVHIVRNSLDHGIELPEVRLAAGKPAIGTLKISAKQESDRVVIEISDDGKGIDPEAIKKKAYQNGLIDEYTLEHISDVEAVNLIFAAGLSTTEVVSDLSGRGVGMDVVRSAVDRVNGSIHLNSLKGRGTALSLSLPLSMAVTNVMTVTSGGQLFGVPIDVVVETVRVPMTAVRKIKLHQATVLRGSLVPLLSLNTLLGLASPPLQNDSDELAALVVRAGDDTVGLLVDQFHSTVDIILKPLGGVLGNLKCYSGSALMGDGSVLMVLNVKEML